MVERTARGSGLELIEDAMFDAFWGRCWRESKWKCQEKLAQVSAPLQFSAAPREPPLLSFSIVSVSASVSSLHLWHASIFTSLFSFLLSVFISCSLHLCYSHLVRFLVSCLLRIYWSREFVCLGFSFVPLPWSLSPLSAYRNLLVVFTLATGTAKEAPARIYFAKLPPSANFNTRPPFISRFIWSSNFFLFRFFFSVHLPFLISWSISIFCEPLRLFLASSASSRPPHTPPSLKLIWSRRSER